MKTCEEIFREMLACYTEKTGFSMEDSADLAVRLYAAAAQLESLYAYCDWSVGQSFPQTAAGEYLAHHGALRGLRRKDGSCAAGTIRFSVEAARQQPMSIAKGTVCTTAGLVRFATTSDAAVAAGTLFVDVAAVAEAPGAAGNVAAGAVKQMSQPPAGVAACTNVQPFTGGMDVESDEALRARILESFTRLPNGANRAFYETRTLAHTGVGGVSVLARPNGAGTVKVVVAADAGSPSTQLLEEIREDLQSVREIAVTVTVAAPTLRSCNVTVRILPRDNVSFADAKAAVERAIGGYFTGKLLGKPVYLAELGSLVFGTGLVQNYKITAPTVDVAAEPSTLARLGTLLVTEGV